MNQNKFIFKKPTLSLIFLAWFACALFYFYQYILRVLPGVLVTDLRQTFHLPAEQFATLGAFYLYAYAFCQIPLGIIVDYVGVRKTMIASILFCIFGTLLLALAPDLFVLQLSRILVGMGSACAFMCALKVIVDYLPSGKRGFLMGATLALGTLGALVAGKPLAHLADVFGWHATVYQIACLGLFVLLTAFLFLPRLQKSTAQTLSTSGFLPTIRDSLVEIMKNRSVMIYAILAIGVYTPLSVLADLWGIAFLMKKYEIDRTQAAGICMMMYLGLGIGSLILPWLSEKYNCLNRSIQLSTLGVLIIFALLLYGPLWSSLQLKICLTFLGIFCGVEMLCFAGAARYTTSSNVGTTMGVVNTLNMLEGGILQQMIGWTLDHNWSQQLDEHQVRLYTTHEFTIALSILLVVILTCFLLSLKLPKNQFLPNTNDSVLEESPENSENVSGT